MNLLHSGWLAALLIAAIAGSAAAQKPKDGARGWVVVWTGSAQGPYPIGNATAQPELKFALPDAERGATDQSFRLILRPDVWGKEARIRLANTFGTKPVTFDDIMLGLQTSGSALVPRSNHAITFAGKSSLTLGRAKALSRIGFPCHG